MRLPDYKAVCLPVFPPASYKCEVDRERAAVGTVVAGISGSRHILKVMKLVGGPEWLILARQKMWGPFVLTHHVDLAATV